MGLILDARCDGCGYARSGLRLGATSAQMSADRRSAFHVLACPHCRGLASVELFLGEERVEGPCEACGQSFLPTRAREVRIVTLKGETLEGHSCARCGARKLRFERKGQFL